ncbi:MAG: chorismate-binding protein [Candidatus Gracilibacteria bacterium]|nr:chorismate-binding protein [Candidatus Gracilibacteria bacterium]
MKTHSHQPYAIIEKDDVITRYDGILYKFASLQGLQEFYKQQTSTIIFLTPFCTIRERGFESHGDEPILAIQVSNITSLTRESIEKTLSGKDIRFEHPITPLQSDDEFADIVRQIQQTEIAGGNICQMILSQPYTGKIQDFSEHDVESAFRNALRQKGQYMTLFFSDGEGEYFVSLTPEQHLMITPDRVTMDPIAGTLKKGAPETFRERLLQFLEDTKERNELFQVLDEELKMMEIVCDEGGKIEGPFLRQNGAVVHTEYKLIGKRSPRIEPLDALRETLHAPTLVGGPIESAARLIKKYEKQSRRYYGGEIGILTPDGDLDTAILIRMAHFDADGTVTIQAGAGITKNSKPLGEAQEVKMKTGGMQAALLGKSQTPPDVQSILDDPEVITKLQERNKYLSKFHFLEQSEQKTCEQLQGKTVTIIDNEDNFTNMLARMMTTMGMIVDIVKTIDFDSTTDASDIIVIGPGPGNINDMSDSKMKTLAEHTRELMKQKKNLLGICLGHQSIAKEMGLSVQAMSESKQGQQDKVYINGAYENVGFYNSFVPIFHKRSGYFDAGANHYPLDVIQERNISGFQFHPESVMSENGYEILKNELQRMLSYK